jgi:two-component system cell cycle sensor histidine kinase/response regulator CckA
MTRSQSPLDADPASKEKLEIISRLAGGIAHDYNNLLAVVLLHADMLASHDDESVKRRAKEIKMAAQRASALTRQLLAFGGRQVMTVRAVDLPEELERLLPALQRILGGSITLITRYDENVRLVSSDVIYLEQVLINIFKNAHDALPLGGQVTFTTTLQTEPLRRVVIAINDNGIGMDPNVLARAFEPFFSTSKGKKTGLGLSTAFGLVKQMGGEITVDSELDKGTTVRIYLQEYEEVVSFIAELQKQSRGGETVLLVDDEEMVRSASCEMLELFGYQVIEARDGFEALEICEECDDPIALALVDIEMDRMDGPTLAKKIRERWPDIKILFMSGLTEDVVHDEGILPPGERFISKPYDPDNLAERVRSMIEEK